MIRGQQRGDGASRAVFHKPKIFRFRLIDEDLEVVESPLLVGLLPQELPAGEDYLVGVEFDCCGSCHQRLVRPWPEHVVRIGMIERNFLVFETGECVHIRRGHEALPRLPSAMLDCKLG